MDLELDEAQAAIRDLAREIFTGHCTAERLKEIDAEPARFDRALWAELARAGVLDAASEDMVAAALVLEQQGVAVAPVPLWPHLVASMALGESPKEILTVALPPDGGEPTVEARGNSLFGSVPLVPAVDVAASVVVATRSGAFVCALGDVSKTPQRVTGGETRHVLSFEGITATSVERDLSWILERATVALCAVQSGVCDAAMRLTADYVGGRTQFDRPLGSFQAVQQRLADCYIDCQAMRWTMLQAAWRLQAGEPAGEEVAIAKLWAAEGGARVAGASQHLHGGIGVDVDYPLHRHTLWAKQLELELGGAGAQLARLGEMLAR